MGKWLIVFYGFEYDFFMVGKMTYVFFYGFEYVFLWFWIRFLILIDFGRVSLSQKPFPTTEPDFEAKLKKYVKTIVNATKVPRTWFLAKNSRNLRFVYDFFTILRGLPFPRSLSTTRTWFGAKIVKKSYMQPRSREPSF